MFLEFLLVFLFCFNFAILDVSEKTEEDEEDGGGGESPPSSSSWCFVFLVFLVFSSNRNTCTMALYPIHACNMCLVRIMMSIVLVPGQCGKRESKREQERERKRKREKEREERRREKTKISIFTLYLHIVSPTLWSHPPSLDPLTP